MTAIRTATGRTINYDEAGDGPPLLLIAGHLVARRAWETVAPVFATQFRTIAMDNRDAGENEPEAAPYTIAEMAGDAVALLDALGIARAHVVGHSMGVSTALRVALDHPERVDRLVLVSGGAANPRPEGTPARTPPDRATWIADPSERARARSVAAVAPGYFDMHPDQFATVVAQEGGNRMTYEGMARQFNALTQEATRPRLGAITVPALVIHGDRDPFVPFTQGETLAAEIPGARFVPLPGVGHRPFVECADDFTRAVLDFLAE